MQIEQLVAMAQRIHDMEGYNLGSSSTREYRNAFWARVVGCAYHGHPVYNPSPDRQWHIKNAGGGRPQSDDVAVSMPSRAYWDCIPGSGADGYSFRAQGHAEPLSLEQNVYAPPVPSGSAGSGGGGGNGGGGSTPGLSREEVQRMIDVSLAPVKAELAGLQSRVAELEANAVRFGQNVALRSNKGDGKLICAENGGPDHDNQFFDLTARTNVGPWESWRLERGEG